MSLVFQWDPKKSAANVRKHGISFSEAMTAFQDPLARIHDDPDHSEEEHREILVGKSTSGRTCVVAFTARGLDVRIISARPATRRERKDYEEALQL